MRIGIKVGERIGVAVTYEVSSSIHPRMADNVEIRNDPLTDKGTVDPARNPGERGVLVPMTNKGSLIR